MVMAKHKILQLLNKNEMNKNNDCTFFILQNKMQGQPIFENK